MHRQIDPLAVTAGPQQGAKNASHQLTPAPEITQVVAATLTSVARP